MIGIGTAIGIAANVFRALGNSNPQETPTNKVDQLFSQLDPAGKGTIEKADLHNAFDKLTANALQKADHLFAKIDADGNGAVTREEFTGSVSKLAEQLENRLMQLRMHGSSGDEAGFTRDELTGLMTNISDNFAKADANADSKVTLKEAMQLLKADGAESGSARQDADLMLQVVRLMQAYGLGQDNDHHAANKTTRISVTA